jgi:hypothetical protein
MLNLNLKSLAKRLMLVAFAASSCLPGCINDISTPSSTGGDLAPVDAAQPVSPSSRVKDPSMSWGDDLWDFSGAKTCTGDLGSFIPVDGPVTEIQVAARIVSGTRVKLEIWKFNFIGGYNQRVAERVIEPGTHYQTVSYNPLFREYVQIRVKGADGGDTYRFKWVGKFSD